MTTAELLSLFLRWLAKEVGAALTAALTTLFSTAVVGLGGYDPQLVGRLDPWQQAQLVLSVATVMGSSLGAGFGLGVLLSLALDSWWLGGLGWLAGSVVMLNLQRVVIAGSAHPCGNPQPLRRWSPPLVPLLMLSAVAAVFSQPILVAVFTLGPEGSPEQIRHSMVELRRRALEVEHQVRIEEVRARITALQVTQAELAEARDQLDRQAEGDPEAVRGDRLQLGQRQRQLREQVLTEEGQVERLEAERDRALGPDLDSYRRHLEDSNLLVERLRQAWSSPLLAATLTLLLVGGITMSMWTRWLLRGAVDAYLLERLHLERSWIEVHHRRARLGADAYLGSSRGRGDSAWADPPFNTQPLPPLRPQLGDPRLRRVSVDEVRRAL